MLIIQGKLVSLDLVEEHFVCKLDACKGACCWEGDFGAPLEPQELKVLEDTYEDVRPFLSRGGIEVIEQKGLFVYYEEPKEYGTPLLENGACAYLVHNQDGTAQCGFEKAFEAGATDFKKPLSCHLYPVRVTENPKTGFEALNYDRWEICSAACSLGKELQMPVFRFVREALIRKYGEDFYGELEAAAAYLQDQKLGENEQA